MNDAAAVAVEGKRLKGVPGSALAPIWLTSLNQTERDCVIEHRQLWKKLVGGTSNMQVLFSSYAGFFESLAKTLYGDDAPANLKRESPFTILDRVYDKLCRYEYAIIDNKLKLAFEDQSKAHKVRPAWRYYRMLREGYVRQGITFPYEAINQVDPDVQFLEKKVWKGLQKDLAALLARVERRVRAEGTLQQILSGMQLPHWGGFVPRYIAMSKKKIRAGKTRTISKHSVGLAIDLEYPTNPHIKGIVARTIDDILGHLATQGKHVSGRIRRLFEGYDKTSMNDYDRLREISDVIVEFLKEWLPKWESFQHTLSREANLTSSSMSDTEWNAVAEDRKRHMDKSHSDQHYKKCMDLVGRLIGAWGGIEKAKFYHEHGLVSLDRALFEAMKAEGVESGIEWKGHKDVMHFEMRTSIKAWAQKKGFTKPVD